MGDVPLTKGMVHQPERGRFKRRTWKIPRQMAFVPCFHVLEFPSSIKRVHLLFWSGQPNNVWFRFVWYLMLDLAASIGLLVSESMFLERM
ncbi:hypothetical protein AVEN_207671-1 [Araneus ventricosus]|uniref:Uncharacterized protein n=1 Tax=Araneus ventricosus TaxID=182803 RepID=A0A4Y2LLL6_ARAVE|nr:hypothetical protein AVEN_207671-1 [Araneus ventricosus]